MGANVKLQQARISKKIDQEQLARILGISTSAYGRWEQGKSEPSLRNLRALCAYFQMPPEELGYVIYQRSEPAGATRHDQSHEQVL